MDNNTNFTLIAIILLLLAPIGTGERIKDKIYDSVDGSNICFRRLNATHQIGCTSKRGGSVAVVHFCETESDLEFILKNGTAAPYAPVMPIKLFNKNSLKLCLASGLVAGLVLYNDKTKLPDFSHEHQCPNPRSSIPGTCSDDSIWNPKGTGILYEDIPIPIFYVNDAVHLKNTKDCFNKHNNFSYDTQKDRSLCSIELSSFMYATTDTPTCIRRSNHVPNLNPVRFCDPLSDQNVWSSLFPLVAIENVTEPVKFKYIIISARLDTTALNEKTAGAQSPITGIVALLTTAKLLKTILPKNKNYENNVLFILFNGETYDYIGSQRFLYEMLQNNFPAKGLNKNSTLPQIEIDDVSLFVELSQLGNNGNVVAHYLYPKDKVSDFLNKLSNNTGGINLIKSSGTLPPSSLHTFLKNKTDLPGVVLADHKAAYSNHFYNSIFDNSSNIDFSYYNSSNDEGFPNNSIQKWIGNVSEMVAKSVYEEITKQKYDGSDEADLEFVNELFYCYLESANCKVHDAIQKMKLQNEPLNMYISVGVSDLFTTLVGLTLSWVTADDIGEGNQNCTNYPRNYAFRYYNMSKSLKELNTTRCYRVSMNFTDAISPAFVIEDYDWSSGLYSSWSESTWTDINIRIFLKPSKAHENMTIAIGSMMLIFSFLITYFVKSRAEILFAPTSLPTLAPTNC